MGISLWDPGQVADELNAKLATGEWWFIINNLEVTSVVEGRYYQGEANELLEILMAGGPYVGFTVSMAHKSRMDSLQLAECLHEAGMEVSVEEVQASLRDQDILFPCREEDEYMRNQQVFAALISAGRNA